MARHGARSAWASSLLRFFPSRALTPPIDDLIAPPPASKWPSTPPLRLPRQQGDPTYLVVTQDGKIEDYGINAVCTHLGCVVPWNAVSSSRQSAVAVQPPGGSGAGAAAMAAVIGVASRCRRRQARGLGGTEARPAAGFPQQRHAQRVPRRGGAVVPQLAQRMLPPCLLTPYPPPLFITTRPPKKHRPRTSSSARATAASTTRPARRSAAPRRWCVYLVSLCFLGGAAAVSFLVFATRCLCSAYRPRRSLAVPLTHLTHLPTSTPRKPQQNKTVARPRARQGRRRRQRAAQRLDGDRLPHRRGAVVEVKRPPGLRPWRARESWRVRVWSAAAGGAAG